MPTKKLTDRTVAHVKAPAAGRLELWDAVLPGFGLRVTEKDARTWFIMYRAATAEGRKQRRLKIADAKIVDLGEARTLAREALRKVARGIDPAEEVRAPALGNDDTVRAIVGDYLSRYVAKNTKPSTYKETKRIFDVDVVPAWGARPVKSIARRDVNELLERIADRGAEIQANRTLARLKTLFAWCVDEEILEVSPVARMKPKTRERSRDRALSDSEIRWFWEGSGAMGWPFGPLFRLLLLTAQRRDEVGTIERSEVNPEQRLWIIPREKAKNDRAHEVALSDLTLEVLADLLKLRGRIDELKASPLIFTTNGKTPVSGFSRAKQRLDREMEESARESRGFPKDDDGYRKALGLKAGDELPRLVPEWILHDLRRTAATGMAKLNIPPHVVDKVLNHVSGTIRGVAAVYNRHAYTEERHAALQAWGEYVAQLVRASAVHG